jgi:hypothetical protein
MAGAASAVLAAALVVDALVVDDAPGQTDRGRGDPQCVCS